MICVTEIVLPDWTFPNHSGTLKHAGASRNGGTTIWNKLHKLKTKEYDNEYYRTKLIK